MIRITVGIAFLLKDLTTEQQEIVLKHAWNACCGGEILKEFYDYDFDPWDGNHEVIRDQIELEMVESSIDILIPRDKD